VHNRARAWIEQCRARSRRGKYVRLMRGAVILTAPADRRRQHRARQTRSERGRPSRPARQGPPAGTVSFTSDPRRSHSADPCRLRPSLYAHSVYRQRSRKRWVRTEVALRFSMRAACGSKRHSARASAVHGTTLGALSLSGNGGQTRPFEGSMSSVVRLPRTRIGRPGGLAGGFSFAVLRMN